MASSTAGFALDAVSCQPLPISNSGINWTLYTSVAFIVLGCASATYVNTSAISVRLHVTLLHLKGTDTFGATGESRRKLLLTKNMLNLPHNYMSNNLCVWLIQCKDVCAKLDGVYVSQCQIILGREVRKNFIIFHMPPFKESKPHAMRRGIAWITSLWCPCFQCFKTQN